MGFSLMRSAATEPTRNLFFEGIQTRNASPSLTISKIVFPMMGAWPIMRISAGRCARRKAFASWYSSMTPLYFEPAVGLSSTVAFTLFTARAISLYLSSSSSRVASRTTALACGGNFVMVLMRPPQPQENDASVAQTIQVSTRMFNPAVLIDTKRAIKQPQECASTREPWTMDSVRPHNIYVKFLHCRTNAADYLRGPEGWAEQGHPAVFGLADGTTNVTGIRGLIGI